MIRLEELKENYIADYLYIMKNMTYMQYCDYYTVGESDTIYLLFPENLNTDYDLIISEEVVDSSPVSLAKRR